MQLQVKTKDGESALNVFPAAVMSYKEKEETVILLEDVMVFDPAEQVTLAYNNLSSIWRVHRLRCCKPNDKKLP